MSKILSDLMAANHQRNGKYTELVNRQKTRESTHGNSLYLYLTVVTLIIASVTVLSLSWKHYSYQRSRERAFGDMSTTLVRQKERIASLSQELDTLRAGQAEQDQKISGVKSVVRGISHKTYKENKQFDEMMMDYRLMVNKLEELERNNQRLMDQVNDIMDEVGLLKRLQAKS